MASNYFIGTFQNTLTPEHCKGIIDLFEELEEHHYPGLSGLGEEIAVHKELKDSTDITIDVTSEQPLLSSMLAMLDMCIDVYIQKFHFMSTGCPFKISNTFNLQRYLPGQGYKAWHCENQSENKRCLAWMIYLNDVPDGGTEFNYDLPNLNATAGMCAIWPAYWTHHHRGIVSHTTTKYIATGWYEYV